MNYRKHWKWWAIGVVLVAIVVATTLQSPEPQVCNPIKALTKHGWVAQPGIGGSVILTKPGIEINVYQVSNQHCTKFENVRGVVHVLMGYIHPDIGKSPPEANSLQVGELRIRGSSADLLEVREILTK